MQPQAYPSQGYPPQQGGYPPQGYPPQQGGYPPQGYPPQQLGYPPQGYPPQQGGYSSQGYPPQHGGYPSQGYPPQQGAYPPQGYPPQGYPQGAYPPHQQPPKTQKGFDRLADRDGLFIKQKIDILEAMTGCEQGNTYHVFPMSKDGNKKGKKIFKCKEKSSCFAKQCMSGDCRPFQMKVNLEDATEELDNEPFLLLDRQCKCTCMCFNRPEMTVAWVEDGKNEYIGKIKDIWQCCNICNEVYDKDNNLRYKIEANCCQIGMHCKGPCESCEHVDFEIKSPSGEIVSTLVKKSPGCVAAMVSDADNFSLSFPSNATKEDKALLMSAVLLLDFRYFEEKGGNQGGGHY